MKKLDRADLWQLCQSPQYWDAITDLVNACRDEANALNGIQAGEQRLGAAEANKTKALSRISYLESKEPA